MEEIPFFWVNGSLILVEIFDFLITQKSRIENIKTLGPRAIFYDYDFVGCPTLGHPTDFQNT